MISEMSRNKFVAISVLQLLCSWKASSEMVDGENPLENVGLFVNEAVIRNGTCDGGNVLAEIEVNSTTPEKHVLTICHNERLGMTLWSQHYLYSNRSGEATCPTNQFRNTDFFTGIDVNDCYKQITQNVTIGMRLGNFSHGYHIPNRNLFLSRGHLAPNCDPITTDEKNATYNYINAHPQWQSINGGNWRDLEQELIRKVKTESSIYKIWTGTYGTLQLPGTSGNVDIYLGRNSMGGLVDMLPVNKFTWKVVQDIKTNRGLAIIMINNPWVKNAFNEKFCTDVCGTIDPLIPWVNWQIADVVRGYTFCCSVADFKRVVTYAPDLGNLSLLV